jgi:trans-aconitate methyltransferase
MAGVARGAFAPDPRVTIEQAEFERWQSPAASFALVFSAQAWHWISPKVRYARARAVLRPGGALAAFWSTPDWESSPLRGELASVYERLAPDLGACCARTQTTSCSARAWSRCSPGSARSSSSTAVGWR